jgi:hypothetical protein
MPKPDVIIATWRYQTTEKGRHSADRFLSSITNRIKLIYRLVMDPRVNMFLKVLPFTSLAYFIFPDLMPGPVDDAVIVWLSTYLFVELCPPEVVDEHLREINRVITGDYATLTPTSRRSSKGEVVDEVS